MSEPLTHKKRIIMFDMVGVHPVQTKYDINGRYFQEVDVRSAVEGLLDVAIIEDLTNERICPVCNRNSHLIFINNVDCKQYCYWCLIEHWFPVFKERGA